MRVILAIVILTAIILPLSVWADRNVAWGATYQPGPNGLCPTMSRAESRKHLLDYIKKHPEALGNAGWDVTGSAYSKSATYEIWRVDLGGKIVLRIPLRNKCPHS